MLRVLLVLLLFWLGRLYAQTNEGGLSFGIGLSPSYVHFSPDGTEDNWSGDKASYATMSLGSINWTFANDETSVGLGGGAFIWGDRILCPVFLQIGLDLSVLYRDTTTISGFARRLSMETRIGTMLGNIETTTGKLTPQVWFDASIMYRTGRNAHAAFHIGVELGIFNWQGPYQVRTVDAWEEAKPQISTVGPVVQFRF